MQKLERTKAPSATLPVMALSELANISFGAGPSEITRQNKLREIDVTAGLDTAPLGARRCKRRRRS